MNKSKDTIMDSIPFAEKASKAEELLNKYKKPLMYAGLVLFVLGGAFAFYKYNQSENNKQGQIDMIAAVNYWELDSLDKAIKGDGKTLGLLDIAEQYSGTDAGNLANYYLGVAYLKKGKYEDAISYLKAFDGHNDDLVQARAYSLIGDAYMEQNDFENAISFYQKASETKANEQFSPRYLMKLALAYESSKDFANASKSYAKIISEYDKAPEATDAKKLKAKADAMIAAQ